MTTPPLSTKLRKLIAKEMAAGKCVSEEETIKKARAALAERRQTLAAISRGLDDAEAGRMRPWREIKRDRLARKPHLAGQ